MDETRAGRERADALIEPDEQPEGCGCRFLSHMRQKSVVCDSGSHNLRKSGSGLPRWEYVIARMALTALRSDMLSAATSLIA